MPVEKLKAFLEESGVRYVTMSHDESALNSYGLHATRVFRTNRFRDFWQNARGAYDPGFVAFFEARMAGK
jgi:hypothetical protein